MFTLNTFEMIVVCLGSGAVGACAALLARIDRATDRDTRTLRASLQNLAAAAMEDGEYIEELEGDVLDLTNETMELQETLHDIRAILDATLEHFAREFDSEEE